MSSMNPDWFNSPFTAAAQAQDWDKTNPFFVPPPAAEPSGSDVEYALVATVPLTSHDEFETYDDAVMITVAWGTNVLFAKQINAGKSLVFGDGTSEFVLPESARMERWPVIVARPGSGTHCVVPGDVDGSIDIEGRLVTIATAKAERMITPSAELPNSFELALRQGASVRMELETGLIVTVTAERAGRKIVPVAGTMLTTLADRYIALSLVAHLGILGVVGGIMPKMNGDDAEEMTRDDLLMMQHMLEASAENEKERQEETGSGMPNSDPKAGGDGKRAEDLEGKLGAKSAPTRNATYAVLKQNDGPKTLSRKEQLELAKDFGMVALIGTMNSARSNNAPAAIWGEDPNGRDEKNAMGNMFGAEQADANGTTGLGIQGDYEGGGGKWRGIGTGDVGDLGRGIFGDPDGQGSGPGGKGGGCAHPPCIGGNPGHLPPGHTPKGPTMTMSTPQVNGHLPADVIQRIVRMNFGRFRSCYDAGLRTNPSLTGRVVTKFAISRDGAVNMTQDGGSDLPDQSVVQCVVRNFGSLSFPSPEGGVVTVTYPIIFTPGQ